MASGDINAQTRRRIQRWNLNSSTWFAYATKRKEHHKNQRTSCWTACICKVRWQGSLFRSAPFNLSIINWLWAGQHAIPISIHNINHGTTESQAMSPSSFVAAVVVHNSHKPCSKTLGSERVTKAFGRVMHLRRSKICGVDSTHAGLSWWNPSASWSLLPAGHKEWMSCRPGIRAVQGHAHFAGKIQSASQSTRLIFEKKRDEKTENWKKYASPLCWIIHRGPAARSFIRYRFVLGYSPHPSDEAQHTPRKMARIHAFKKGYTI